MSLPEKDVELEQAFPAILVQGYEITSPKTSNYNCIAWAGNVDHLWWWPDQADTGFWPDGVIRECTIEAFISAYETIDFKVCTSSDFEDGFEKIAIFTDAFNIPKHAARQLDANRWTSKMGHSFDLSHSLDGVAGINYGSPKVFMKRLKVRIRGDGRNG